MTAPTVTVLHGGELPPNLGEIERLAQVRTARADGLAEALRGSDVLLTWDFTTPALGSAWAGADRLRWVHTASAGIDNVLTADVRDSDVVVTNSRGVFETPIAEYVTGLVLMTAKDMLGTWQRQQRREWEHRETRRVQGREAVVVGVGPIGRAVGRMLAAVGLRVRGVGRTRRSADPDFGEVAAGDDLGAVVAGADYLVLVAPLTEQTRGMVDRDVLAAMPSSAMLVNVGRGELVVEDDLVRALQAGDIAAAALDVFEKEPLPPDSPLWTMPHVLVSPHMSADTVGWRDDLAALFLENLGRWCRGEQLRNVVDKQLGYVPST
ncbi:MAG TPA: D-2-hydroxyacid dehydrogenase [Nocardioidaceae bacterium]|nr:D-2-hydroxyacid dehydrogenase [Nocardioidaceae bacterium]